MQNTPDIFNRTEALIGAAALQRIAESRVAVFGVGGVGSYTVEGLARAGIGELTLIDKDRVSADNINRQLPALLSTLGMPKVEVMAARIRDINPAAVVITRHEFFLPENSSDFNLAEYDYIVDAVDTVTAKIELAVQCAQIGTPLISCMGAGNKLDPLQFRVADIFETSICPLCKVMRKELRRRGVESLKVVFSAEEPVMRSKRPASISFVPSVAGLIVAGEVVRELMGVRIAGVRECGSAGIKGV